MPLLRPCKNTAAFEVLPDDPKAEVDLSTVEDALCAEGWERVVNAGVMLIVRRSIELSVYRSGKMLIKTRDPDVAQQAYRDVRPHVMPDAPDAPRVEGLDRLARRPTPPTADGTA